MNAKGVAIMLTRGRLTITVLVFLGILGLASAALVNSSTNERGQMNRTQGEVPQITEIPTIDASAPIKTETAMFSLG